MSGRVVEVAEKAYIIGTMDAMTQFHVTRRLAPLLSGVMKSIDLMDVFTQIKTTDLDNPEDEAATAERMAKTMASGAQMINEILNSMAELTDENAEYIIYNCLKCVQRGNGEGLPSSPVFNRASNTLQFQDISASTMLVLTKCVCEDNLMSFFAELLSGSLLK